MRVAFAIMSFIICIISTSVHAVCQTWPKGMVFVGLTDAGWNTYVVTKSSSPPVKVNLNTEARTPVFSATQKSLIYIDEAGQLSRYSLATQKTVVLLKPSAEASYAQPEFDEANNSVYVVELKQGKSVDTDIIKLVLTLSKSKPKHGPVIIQRSAQFEPHHTNDWLYYSNVHCVVGCGKIIQEIWRYHITSGLAEQVTLLNSISRQPSTDQQHNWLYFSSNAAGHYHIYRQALNDKNTTTIEQLTQGTVTDMSPVMYQGQLFFIRQSAQQAQLMCRDNSGQVHAMTLPTGIKDLRDLEIN